MTFISFPFKGGPLDGMEARHRPLPAKPEEPMPYRLKTGPEHAGVEKDREAQGRYRLENRDGQWVAVHHPSDYDQPWHEVEPVVEAKEAEEIPVPGMAITLNKPADPKRRRVEIPADSILGRKLARMAKDLGFVKQLREKESKKPSE